MAIESPLFQSAMELVGHSLSHYNGKDELDRKLVILHLANAVELMLKDLVLDSGESIYKSPKETITIHGCISTLQSKGVPIPLLNKIELLVDERNALQHRFGSPNQLTSIFYMGIAQEFFREVLKKQYGLDYDEVILQFADEETLAEFRLAEPSNDQELEKLQELAKLHPLGALLAAWSYFERITADFYKSVGLDFSGHRVFFLDLTKGRLESFGVEFDPALVRDIVEMRKIRNRATHGQLEPSREDVKKTIEAIERAEQHLNKLDLEPIRRLATVEREKYENRAMAMQLYRQREMARDAKCDPVEPEVE